MRVLVDRRVQFAGGALGRCFSLRLPVPAVSVGAASVAAVLHGPIAAAVAAIVADFDLLLV